MTQNSGQDATPSEIGIAGNGLIGRIVENWLTSANERNFQLPFCQLLAAEGETLIYIARHGAFEKGKDVVTRSPSGTLRAYQMKGGNIRQRDWQEIQPQAVDLVELPVVHPSINAIEAHEPFLVTNGRLEDEAIDRINTNNAGWLKRHFEHPLRVIQKDELVSRFIKVHGGFLPKEARDFQRFLTFVLRSGDEPLDKPKFATFIESILPIMEESPAPLAITRSFASLVLMASYALSSSVKAGNHWALVEGWTMVTSYILGLATKHNVGIKYWGDSHDISLLGAERALEGFVQECLNRQEFTEGHSMVDGYVYRSRQLMIAGILSASCLLTRQGRGQPNQALLVLIRQRLRESYVWGESAAPFILLCALELEKECRQLAGEAVVFEYLRLLVASNSGDNRGLPDSFASIEDSIGFMHKITDNLQESFAGFSYTMLPCIEYLTRRLRRQTLATLWRGISGVSLESSVPNDSWEWFRWEAESAVLYSSVVDEPQSWSTLLSLARSRKIDGLPSLLTQSGRFLILFVLVFPHRITPETLAALEEFCWKAVP